jgi:hypothetical protein
VVSFALSRSVWAERNSTPPTDSKFPVAAMLSPMRIGANRYELSTGIPLLTVRLVSGQNGSPVPVASLPATRFPPVTVLGMQAG